MWHFYLLGVVLINFATGLITGYRLNQNLTFILKTILYLDWTNYVLNDNQTV
jgi:hypothetical protein